LPENVGLVKARRKNQENRSGDSLKGRGKPSGESPPW
jgi:hypothetical protein